MGGLRQGGDMPQNGQMTPNGAPGGRLPGNDPAQIAREFRLRRENAEGIRREAAQQGLDTSDLDRAIEAMRQLENGRTFNDPKALEQLQGQALEKLKNFEFALLRSTGMGTDGRPAAGARAAVPAEYRALIEEYYRQLARRKP